MTSMRKGSNLPVPGTALRAVVSWRTDAPTPDVDVSALLLDGAGKVRSDADFVFYNQPSHASGAVRYEGKRPQPGEMADTVLVDLAQVEPSVERVVVGASADGGSFGQVPGLRLRVLAMDGTPVAEFDIGDATSETAYLFGEFYRRDGAWKFRAVGQGYATGLAGLATDFGISVDTDDTPPPPPTPAPAAATPPTAAAPAPQTPPGFGPPPPGYGTPAAPPFMPPTPAPPFTPTPAAPPTPAPPFMPAGTTPAAPPYTPPTATPPAPPFMPTAPAPAPPVAAPPAAQASAPMSLKKQKLITLEKQLSDRGELGLLDLTKRAAVSLEKRGLSEHTARVALCLDISGSMGGLYRAGKVQGLVERVLALGLRFDDNAEVDVFLFGTNGHSAGGVGLDSYRGWTDRMLQQWRLEGGTDYAAAMRLIREEYFGTSALRYGPVADRQPVYVMFVTDGHTTSEQQTRDQVMASSYEPLFWQFMGIGRSAKSVDAPMVAQQQPDPQVKQSRFGRRLRAMAANWSDGTFRFLEELDDLPGRYTDNANFFCVQDPANLTDDQLFDLMTAEYAQWLQRARGLGLITP
ncbi:VWA domain-containing protein [Streptacidiphilus sp. EB129]|uniref:VWA domain-containing protein n=1 Tax=Streptacidiphilus sp. EB129 TaxID=3156262 RepID=UPI0035121638